MISGGWWIRRAGSGQTRSRVSSLLFSYSLILSNRYFHLSRERPWGVIGSGLSAGDGWYPRTPQQLPLFLLRRGSLLEEDYPWTVLLKAEVMVLLDTIQAAEMGGKEPSPISGRHDGTTILGTDQLADVTCRGLLDYTSHVVQRADVGFSELPLNETETGVRGRTWCDQKS